MEEKIVVQTAEQLNEALQEKKEAASYVDFKMVTFSLADKDYAIDIMYVKEIAKAGRFTYVPNTLPFVLGVYNLRGEIIPILDLRLFFNVEVHDQQDKKLQNLLILTLDDQTFGLVVDKIDKVVGVQKSTIQPPHPLFADINIKYISGVVENNNRLYVLLDILRIFGSKDSNENKEAAVEQMAKNAQIPAEAKTAPSAKASAPASAAPQTAPAKKEEPQNLDIKFIAESLKSYKNFDMSQINETWVKHRYTEWASERGHDKTQLQNSADADAFMSNFYSSFTGTWWSKDYADCVKNLLPENNAKQIVVWNPGCGSGVETYCLACVLKSRYPEAKIRIYAQDVDLLGVSNASLLSVPANVEGTWLSPYLTKKANGENTFNQEIKDSIMFEYHDCKNTNVLPMLDVIFARDFLSFLDVKSQENILSEFFEKMKGNGIAIVGENEIIPMSYGFGEISKGAVTAYTKD